MLLPDQRTKVMGRFLRRLTIPKNVVEKVFHERGRELIGTYPDGLFCKCSIEIWRHTSTGKDAARHMFVRPRVFSSSKCESFHPFRRVRKILTRLFLHLEFLR